MPKIWLDYAKFLSKQMQITRTRKVYDRALQSLPASQHPLIWTHYLDWAESLADELPDMAKHVYKRFIQLKPECTLDYIDFLLRHEMLEEALTKYLDILKDENYVTQKQKKNRFQMWMEFCEFLAKYPDSAQHLSMTPDELLRHAIRLYKDQAGKLWVLLADYHTRMGDFFQAREVFEEALAQLSSAREFGLIFNAYLQFE